MVPAFLRTLSARILLGFAVLIVTFGATIAWAVANMTDLSGEIAIIRTGYLQLSLDAKELEAKQAQLLGYLQDDLETEGSPGAVVRNVKRFRQQRDTPLQKLADTLESMKGLTGAHAKVVEGFRARLDQIRRSTEGLDADYQIVLATPPMERVVKNPGPPHDPAAIEDAVLALKRLKKNEATISGAVRALAGDTRRRVEKMGKQLEAGADLLRTLTIVVGSIALLGGLLVTFWVQLTLRPLGRLREAAGRIARGEQGSKLDERGPAEVADLAREFNVMALAIEERERELVRSERLAAVGKMAAMITHEVRNPLSSIALNVDLLGDELDKLGEADAVEARALCRAITDEVDRLTGITEEYLAFARLPKPRLASESVNQVVESLAQFVREDLSSRGVKLELALAADLPRGLIDEAQIRQSLLNLVRNAAEAGGSTVTMSTRPGDAGSLEIEVADDGPGIAADLQGRLFDPFFSTKEGGTGLGLALTNQIVRDHGGDIRVRSEPGAGARFIVTLPVAPPEP